jgi:S-adenosylmethionine synthetase
MRKGLFTSETVGPGHPDKICDQISDAILDALLTQDPNSRVAVNSSIKNNKVFVFGEVTTMAKVDYREETLKVLRGIGLKENFEIMTEISTQSPDISQGVDTGGAGDQGMMVGYATDETKDYMPLPIHIANKIMVAVDSARREGSLKWAGPDMKCQVTVDYSEINNPWNAGRCPVRTIVLSVQHSNDYLESEFKEVLGGIVRRQLMAMDYSFYPKYRLYINNTGKFVTGGSYGDSGLTGRKIIVDTYGGMVPHGGGAFSGKDCTKVDRSAAYAARWIAKNIVASGLAKECEIQIAYAIGEAKPVSISVDTKGTGDEGKIEKMIGELFELTPEWIRNRLGLRKPVYRQTSVFGHFGRPELNLPWEKLDLIDEIKNYTRK